MKKNYTDEAFIEGLKDQVAILNELIYGVERARLAHQVISGELELIRSNLKELKNQHEPKFDWEFLEVASIMRLW